MLLSVLGLMGEGRDGAPGGLEGEEPRAGAPGGRIGRRPGRAGLWLRLFGWGLVLRRSGVLPPGEDGESYLTVD